MLACQKTTNKTEVKTPADTDQQKPGNKAGDTDKTSADKLSELKPAPMEKWETLPTFSVEDRTILAQVEAGEFSRADAEILTRLNHKISDVNAHLLASEISMARQQYVKALSQVEVALSYGLSTQQAQIQQARIWIARGELSHAIGLLESLLDDEAYGLRAALHLVSIYLQAGDFERADKIMQTLDAKHADNPHRLSISADIAYNKGDYKQATGDYEHALKASEEVFSLPERRSMHRKAAKIYELKLQDKTNACKHYSWLLSHASQNDATANDKASYDFLCTD